MTLAAWFVGGLAVACVLWLALAPAWHQPLFVRRNYRGVDVPTAGGVAAVIAAVVVAAAAAVVDKDGVRADVAAVVIATVGFGLLGAIDDLAGDDDRKGFRGHVGALAGGRLTTGGLKLIGGLAVAAFALAPVEGRVDLLDVVLVAAAANLGNLFDRAPGRVVKVAVLSFAALLLGGTAGLAGAALVVGAVVGLSPFDLREKLMLGDAGANAVGAALGVGAVVATPGTNVTLAITIGLIVLNLVSELVSFSRVIAAVPPLRWLDGLGRIKVAS